VNCDHINSIESAAGPERYPDDGREEEQKRQRMNGKKEEGGIRTDAGAYSIARRTGAPTPNSANIGL